MEVNIDNWKEYRNWFPATNHEPRGYVDAVSEMIKDFKAIDSKLDLTNDQKMEMFREFFKEREKFVEFAAKNYG